MAQVGSSDLDLFALHDLANLRDVDAVVLPAEIEFENLNLISASLEEDIALIRG